jgi:hypothetical protein
VARALTSTTSKPRPSSSSKSGIQYTPVASIATVLISNEVSQSASASKSSVKLVKQRTDSSHKSGSTATHCSRLPMSIPAQLG